MNGQVFGQRMGYVPAVDMKERNKSRMTLLELSVEYRTSAKTLAERITLLRLERKGLRTWSERSLMDARIDSLSTMQREARELAVLMERYYERGYRRNVKYSI